MALDRHILVAVDSTGRSVGMARALLETPGFATARVTALHVVTEQIVAAKVAENRIRGEQYLDDAVAKLQAQPDIKVTTRLELGDAKTTVLKVADDIDASLIVMGARGMGRIISILKNSVSQYVFQLSTRPMLLVKEDNFISKVRRIMVAIDSSAAAQAALREAIALVRYIPRSEILLARVRKPAAASGKDSDLKDLERDDKVLSQAKALLKREGIPHRTYFAVGKPGPEIVTLSDDSGADLLVMGSPDRRPTVAKGLPDFERLLGQSVSDYVRVNAACPVLMTRQQE